MNLNGQFWVELKNRISVLEEILSKQKYQLIALAFIFLLGPIFAISSDIIVTKTWEFNQTIELPRVILMFALVGLISLNLTTAIFNYDQHKISGVKKTTGLGILGALFTSACPFCQPVWLFWLGFGSVTAFVSEISLYLGLLSLILLTLSLYKNLDNRCKVKGKWKK